MARAHLPDLFQGRKRRETPGHTLPHQEKRTTTSTEKQPAIISTTIKKRINPATEDSLNITQNHVAAGDNNQVVNHFISLPFSKTHSLTCLSPNADTSAREAASFLKQIPRSSANEPLSLGHGSLENSLESRLEVDIGLDANFNNISNFTLPSSEGNRTLQSSIKVNSPVDNTTAGHHYFTSPMSHEHSPHDSLSINPVPSAASSSTQHGLHFNVTTGGTIKSPPQNNQVNQYRSGRSKVDPAIKTQVKGINQHYTGHKKSAVLPKQTHTSQNKTTRDSLLSGDISEHGSALNTSAQSHRAHSRTGALLNPRGSTTPLNHAIAHPRQRPDKCLIDSYRFTRTSHIHNSDKWRKQICQQHSREEEPISEDQAERGQVSLIYRNQLQMSTSYSLDFTLNNLGQNLRNNQKPIQTIRHLIHTIASSYFFQVFLHL